MRAVLVVDANPLFLLLIKTKHPGAGPQFSGQHEDTQRQPCKLTYMADMKVNELHRMKEKGAPTSLYSCPPFLSVSSGYVKADVQRSSMSSYPT
jgi:hypothetical protein